MNKKKLVISGVSIFLVGILVGALGMGAFGKSRMGVMARLDKDGTSFFMDRLDHALSLTAEQKTRITPIMADMLAQVSAARRPCVDMVDAAVHAGAERITRELTPEQAEKYKNMMAKLGEHRKKLLGQ